MSRSIIAALAIALASPAALADHRSRPPDRERGHVEYARVVSVRPVYRSVAVNLPRQECWDERVIYDEGHRHRGNQAAGALIGAVAGGVAGHQFGQGRGNDAATVIGAIIGAGIGQQVARDHHGPDARRVGYEERCQTVRERHYEERIRGYDVTYRYHGRLYDTRMPYDPGERIPVRVDVRPSY